MSLDQQRLVDYLMHILESIERIMQYTKDIDEDSFLDSPMIQDAVIRNIEVIGEASNNIEKHYPEFAAANPALPLAFAYQMRNAVAHGYFKVQTKTGDSAQEPPVSFKTDRRSLRPALYVLSSCFDQPVCALRSRASWRVTCRLPVRFAIRR